MEFRCFNFIKSMWFDIFTHFFSLTSFLLRIHPNTPNPNLGSSSFSPYSLIEGIEAQTPNSCLILNKKAKSRISTPSKTPKTDTNSTPSASRTRSPSSPNTGLEQRFSTMGKLDLTPTFVQDNQSIKRQKLDRETPRHIVDAQPLDLPHKLNPDSVDDVANSDLSPAKEDRKVYIREADVHLMTVAERVKLFESTRRKVYVRRTTSPSISVVAEKVRWFESRTRERPSKVQCIKETIARQEQELQREGDYNQSTKAQKRIFKKKSAFRDSESQIFENSRKPLLEVTNNVNWLEAGRHELGDKIKEKDTMYKRCKEESECAKKREEANAVQLKKTWMPRASPLSKIGNPFFSPKSAKEITILKSPTLTFWQRKQRDLGNVKACSSPATNMR